MRQNAWTDQYTCWECFREYRKCLSNLGNEIPYPSWPLIFQSRIRPWINSWKPSTHPYIFCFFFDTTFVKWAEAICLGFSYNSSNHKKSGSILKVTFYIASSPWLLVVLRNLLCFAVRDTSWNIRHRFNKYVKIKLRQCNRMGKSTMR